jgi:hypothetical protein
LTTNTNLFKEHGKQNFCQKILSKPAFVEQMAAQQQTIAAKST